MIRRYIQRVWTALRSRLGVAKASPSVAPGLQATPGAPNVAFSLDTAVANTAEVTAEIARIREEQRRRFVEGGLFTDLRAVVEANAVLVAHIKEDGSRPADHLLTIEPIVPTPFGSLRSKRRLRR